MVNFLISQVTKVFLASTYVLCNGALVAPMGSSMIACLAQKNHIPVVAVCETYKFADRVNLDQINNNEQGSRRKFIENYLLKNCKNRSHLDEILQKTQRKNQPEIEILNLKYDLTPQKYLSMIVCEIGNIPPHSVPVVIREIMRDYEDDHREHVFDDSDCSDNSSNEEDAEENTFSKRRGDANQKQRRRADMQMVDEEA